MPTYAVPAPAQPAVPIVGSDALFPVRRILCVGRNYAAHRREMGSDDRDPPFFFAKPADAVVTPGGDVAYPGETANLHHEIELVVAIGKTAKNIAVADALSVIFGYAVGVDMTRRDLQNAAKDKGYPWDSSKGFDDSAPISAILPAPGAASPLGAIQLSVNGVSRQDAVVADMIWNVPEIIAEASRLWVLQPGDLIYTGTPEGVGPLVRGDAVTGSVEGVGSISFKVV
jgi:fumarylpyruvate hydrolase